MALIRIDLQEAGTSKEARNVLERLGAASAATVDAATRILSIPDAAVPRLESLLPDAVVLTLGTAGHSKKQRTVSGSFTLGARHKNDALRIIDALGGRASIFPSPDGDLHACFSIEVAAIGQLVEALSRGEIAGFSRASRVVFDDPVETPLLSAARKQERLAASADRKLKKKNRQIHRHRARL